MTLHKICRVFRLTLAALLAGLLTACREPGYPEGWPPVETPWFGCPSLAGAYANPDPSGSRDSLLKDSLFKHFMHGPWATLQLQGDAENALTVQWAPPPEQEARTVNPIADRRISTYPFTASYRWSYPNNVLSGAEFEQRAMKPHTLAPTTRSFFSQRFFLSPDTHNYRCEGGWLISDIYGSEDHDESYGGQIRFARDRWGGLIIHAIRTTDPDSGKVCAGPLCFRYSMGSNPVHQWEKWPAIKDPVSGKPWSEPFTQEIDTTQLLYVEDSAERLDEVRTSINDLRITGLSVEDIAPTREGGGVFVSLIANHPDTFARFFKAGQKLDSFHGESVRSLEQIQGKGWKMVLVIGLRPQASKTPVSLIMRTISLLLPKDVIVRNVEANTVDGGFFAEIEGTEENMIQVMGHLEQSGKFRDVRSMSSLHTDGRIIRRFQLWEAE